jgi:hypothetical protein
VAGRRIPSVIGVDPEITRAAPSTIPVLRVDGAWRIRIFRAFDMPDGLLAECVPDRR